MSADPIRQPIEEEGLVGRLCYPPAPGTHPTVIVLGGSGGGSEARRRGSAVLRGIYGAGALLLRSRPAASKVGREPARLLLQSHHLVEGSIRRRSTSRRCMANSKGGELALLLGTAYPEDIRAVVDYVPRGVVVCQGPSFDLQSVHRPGTHGR